MDKDYRLLLTEAGQLYERHEAGRPAPFNVFSVLRTESDEVNLHSRFLAALLDYRISGKGKRTNLKEFLLTVANVEDFDQAGVAVSRERHNIDILVTNARRQAVVIENKIWAKDRSKQLQRYHEEMTSRGFGGNDIHLRYLTPDGRDPSRDSVGDLKYENIAYRDTSFQEWLRNCQSRAYDEPALREVIGQYLALVQKLTGTDFSGAYMNELRDLCIEGDNLVLVHDLKHAMDEAWIHLIHVLFQEIDNRLRIEITDLPEEHAFSDKSKELTDVSKERVEELVNGRRGSRGWMGLYYGFRDEAHLGIQMDRWNRVSYGVWCSRERTPDAYERIKQELQGDTKDDFWPWREYPSGPVNPSPKAPEKEHLRLLADKREREAFVRDLVEGTARTWEKIKNKGLVPPEGQ